MVNILLFTINLVILLIGTSSVQCSVQKRQTYSNYTEYAYNPASPNSPAHWQEMAAGCNGTSQSPINIQTAKTKKFFSLDIKSTKWTEKPTEINVIHIYSKGIVYQFEQLHFHFGFTRNTGGEHYINNRTYSMEGHAVFFNLKYETFQNALAHQDGLAVIARFYNESDRYSQVAINFKFLENVRNPDDVYSLTSSVFSLKEIIGPLKCPCYTYHGSLTTPDCNEVVTWLVAENQLQISTANLTYFRQLMGNDGLMAPNIRPLQKLNGRTVKYHKTSKA